MIELVCKADNKGVAFFSDGRAVRKFPKVAVVPQRFDNESDETFLDYCFNGTKNIPTFVLEKMDLKEVESIKALKRKALTKIISLKEQTARSWTGFMDNFKNNPKAKNFKINNLNEELYMDIHVPRPIIISELLKLKK